MALAYLLQAPFLCGAVYYKNTNIWFLEKSNDCYHFWWSAI